MLAGCWCRPAQQLLLLMLLTTAGLLLIGLTSLREPALGVLPRPALQSTVPRTAAPVPAGPVPRPGRLRRCPTPSRLLSINSAGRLGNIMSEYATLLAAAGELRRPAWLHPDMARTLAVYFGRLWVPVLPISCRVNWTTISTEELMAKRPDSDTNHMIGGFPHAVPLFHPLRARLLRDFTFRKELRQRADLRLAELAYQAAVTAPTFIGVHVRRTDYSTWLARSVRGRVAGVSYLRRAVALMKSRHRNSLFVVVSDDPEWCRKNLRGLQRVVVAGDGVQNRPGADLALLAACNHTVVTHGTFGFWAAYLAGGEVVAPTGYGRRPTGLEQDVRRARLGWTWLPAKGQ
ncbi:galactoside alpha-(1,2)-fucosyltransferase 2-like [Amphibalanus amphitrite]|uniref:galactoside alpha-(1,2)-fucosyltransferase 2-like n=1 Tax=Amphibalanus amphitrite TaxID=1232801 RepID=UPI001C91099F|nr:galactoside alpha-(1,2)-fucosyltransferase 2-like [Amphibalanus amphitrite]